MKRQPFPGDLVVITWEDSKAYSGWQHYHGAEVTVCRSVGWVLEADEHMIVLGQSRSDTDHDGTMVNGAIAIPTTCITNVDTLRSVLPSATE